MEKITEEKTKIVVPKGKHAFTCAGKIFLLALRFETSQAQHLLFMKNMNSLNRLGMELMVLYAQQLIKQHSIK